MPLGGKVNAITTIPVRRINEPVEDRTGHGGRRHYRTIWISDIHLGTRGCNAEMLIDFLDNVDSDMLYLVGDIVDGWQLRKRIYWPTAHNDVVWRIMKRARRGTRVVYIPGNHDEIFRQFTGMNFGGVEVRRKVIHTTADGRKLLVLHGDEFDAIMLAHRWLAVVGDAAYTMMMAINRQVNQVRKWLKLPYWSLSKMAKNKVKNAVAFISRFEELVAHEAERRHVDGVVCGHIHTAEVRQFGNITYYNDGDWVEGCTALVENHDGTMEVLHWAEEIEARKARTAAEQTRVAA